MNKLRRSLSFGLLGSLPGISWVNSLLFPQAEAKRAGGTVNDVRMVDMDITLESDFAALIDVFVPADEAPGAIDLGIEKPMLIRIRENRKYLGETVQMLDLVNTMTLELFGERFNAANLSQRTDVVLTFLTSGAQYEEVRRQIASLKSSTLSAFYSNKAAFEMLDYHPPSQGGYPDYDRPPL